MQELTDMQRAVLRAVCDYATTHGVAPSVRDVAAACGCSGSTALHHIRALDGRGYVTRLPRIARGLLLEPAGYDALREGDDGHDVADGAGGGAGATD